MKSIYLLFVSLICLTSSLASAQEWSDVPNNPYYANQTARDALNHGSWFYNIDHTQDPYQYGIPLRGWASYPRFGRGNTDFDIQQAFRASEFISNAVGEQLLENPNGNVQTGLISAIANAGTIVERLNDISGEYVDIEDTFHNRALNFFAHPENETYYFAFQADALILKNYILQALLNYDLTLGSQVITVEEVRSLMPLFFYLNNAAELIGNIERSKVSGAYDGQHSEGRNADTEWVAEQYSKISAKLEPNGEYFVMIKGITNRLKSQYRQQQLRASEPAARMTEEVILGHIQEFENEYYEAFVQAVSKYKLTAKQQQMVLQAFADIDLNKPDPTKPNILSSGNINRSGLSIEAVANSQGYRFLQSILMTRFDYGTSYKDLVHDRLKARMLVLNRALVLQIGANYGAGIHNRAADHVKIRVESRNGSAAEAARLRAKAIVGRIAIR